MTPQGLKPGDIIKCLDDKDISETAKQLLSEGYQITMHYRISSTDGDRCWIEIMDPDDVPFPDREEAAHE